MKQFSLEEYLKNPDRKVVTREGKPARIICTDFKNGDYPIIAAILSQNTEVLSTYTKEGSYDVFGEEKTYDLFFTSEKKEGWVNVFESTKGYKYCYKSIFPSEKEARCAGETYKTYIATVKVEWEE